MAATIMAGERAASPETAKPHPCLIRDLAAIVTDQPFTDDATLKQQLQSSESSFAKSAARNIEGAITKDARVISHAAREGGSGGARAGFARVTLTTVRK